MTAERDVTPIVKSWLENTPASSITTRQTVGQVMARVPQTRQRRRWWPFSIRRSPGPATGISSTEFQPASTPATDGHAPTVTGRTMPMFSATKFVVAGVIVALFGGFLLTGVLTQQATEPLPVVGASASASPETSTNSDLLPGVDLVAEEFEPGVYRVLSDGAGNDPTILAKEGTHATAQVVAGQDGSVWLRDRQEGGDDRLFRLGVAGDVDASPLHDRPDISVAPDGTLWALGDSATIEASKGGVGQLFLLRDGEWQRHAKPKGATVTSIETPSDGSVWASLAVERDEVDGCRGGSGRRLAVARLVDGEWIVEGVEPASLAGNGGSLAVGPDGTTLIGTTYVNSCPGSAWTGIAERDEDGWTPSFTPDPKANRGRPGIGPITIGADGTVWAYQHASGSEPWSPRLLRRRTGGVWEVLGDDGSVPLLTGNQTHSSMTVAPDGRLWVALKSPSAIDHHRELGKSIAATLAGPCAGVLSFDGATWTHDLAGACVSHISAAPNGNVWVAVMDLETKSAEARELDTDQPPAGLYVITPEAVAATE